MTCTWNSSEGTSAKLAAVAWPIGEFCNRNTATLTAMREMVTHWK